MRLCDKSTSRKMNFHKLFNKKNISIRFISPIISLCRYLGFFHFCDPFKNFQSTKYGKAYCLTICLLPLNFTIFIMALRHFTPYLDKSKLFLCTDIIKEIVVLATVIISSLNACFLKINNTRKFVEKVYKFELSLTSHKLQKDGRLHLEIFIFVICYFSISLLQFVLWTDYLPALPTLFMLGHNDIIFF